MDLEQVFSLCLGLFSGFILGMLYANHVFNKHVQRIFDSIHELGNDKQHENNSP